MPDRPDTSRRDGWTVGPGKTGAAGFLGGAAVVGMIWAVTTRGPMQTPPPAGAAAPVQAFRADTPASPPPEPVGLTTAPPASKSVETAAAPEPTPEPASDAETAILTPIDLPDPETYPISDPVDPATWHEPAPPPPEPATAALRVSINHAAAAELELLPGVGPVLAGRIVEERQAHGPFRSIEDLQRVRGIGAKTADKLRPFVTFD